MVITLLVMIIASDALSTVIPVGFSPYDFYQSISGDKFETCHLGCTQLYAPLGHSSIYCL